MIRPSMTLDEFLAWEREQELRYEFDGFAVRAMNGGTLAHSEIATNLVEALRRAVRDLCGFACDFAHFPLVGACPDCEALR